MQNNLSIVEEDDVFLASFVMNLIVRCQHFHKRSGSIRCYVAQEVAAISHNTLRLHVTSAKTQFLGITHSLSVDEVAFPSQWNDIFYGILYLKQPSCEISLTAARQLAHICAWLIRTLEDAEYVKQRRPTISSSQLQHLSSLTPREFEVLCLMVKDYSTENIARKLSLSKRTVEKHQNHVYEHLDVKSSQEAVLISLLQGLE